MSNSIYIRDKFATLYKAEALWVSWHNGDPGVTGLNELTAVDRQQLVWGGVINGKIIATPVTVSTWAPGDAITHLGFWTSDAVDAKFVNSAPHPVSYPAGGADTYNISYEHP